MEKLDAVFLEGLRTVLLSVDKLSMENNASEDLWCSSGVDLEFYCWKICFFAIFNYRFFNDFMTYLIPIDGRFIL